MQARVQVEQVLVQTVAVSRPRYSIDTCRGILPQVELNRPERVRCDPMKQRGETLLRVPLCGFQYPVRRLWHVCPTWRSVRALASRIPLDRGPLLRQLRRSVRSLVRRLHGSCDLIRLPQSVHHRLQHSPFPARSRRDRRDRLKISRGPGKRLADVVKPPGSPRPHNSNAIDVAFDRSENSGAPGSSFGS